MTWARHAGITIPEVELVSVGELNGLPTEMTTNSNGAALAVRRFDRPAAGKGAQRFVNQPSQGVLSKVRANGDTVLYDPASNTFGVRAANGAPRTMFRPDPARHGYPTNLDSPGKPPPTAA